MRTTPRISAILLGLIIATAASAQVQKADVYDQFFRYTEAENRATFQERPGETVDPFTGNLSIVQQDAVLSGKAGLDLRIIRTYSSKIWGRADGLTLGDSLLAESARSVLGYGWSLHMGRLSNPNGTGDSGACGSNVPVFESGDGGGSHSFYKSAWNSAVLLSKDYWRYERACAAMGGAGACVWTDKGVRYEFSTVPGNQFYAGTRLVYPVTGIVDQFGNRISVTYVPDTGAIDTITDTWGRTVKFTYQTSMQGHAVEDGRRLVKMTVSDGRGGAGADYTFSHVWVPTGLGQYALPGTGRFFLGSVTPPAGPPQIYEYYAVGGTLAANQYALKKLTYPGGGTTEYTYSQVDYFTGRDVVPFSVVTGRVVGGRGVPSATWAYSYVSPLPVTPAPADPAAYPFHVTTITRPDNRKDVFTMYGFGWIATKAMANPGYSYAFLVGLTRKISKADGAEVEEMGWNARTEAPVTTAAAYSAPVYSDACGTYTVWDDVVLAPQLARHVIWRDGAAFVTDYAGYDAYGQPGTVTENGYQASTLTFSAGRPPVPISSGGTQTRTTTWTYRYFPTEKSTGRPLNLVRGLPAAQHACVGTGNDCVDSSWSYDETSAISGYPRKTETRSGVTTTFGYHDTSAEGVGNLKTVANALGQTLTMAGYGAGWGIATALDFNGAFTVSRTAYWQGWVATTTDGRGRTTSYGYDAIGRPTSVIPPGGALNAPTIISYALDDSAMTATRGTFHSTTELDGLGRKTKTVDGEGITTTVRYDAMGQPWFRSFPSLNAAGGAGEKQVFDGLGRTVTRYRAFTPDAAATNQAGTCETPGACTVWNNYGINCVETVVERSPTESPRTMRCASSFGSPDDQRLAAVADARGGVWQYAYGAAGELLSVEAPLAQGGRSYLYEPLTRFLTDQTTGESGTTSFTRNAIGQPLTRTDARGVVTALGYDLLGRLRTLKYGAGSDDDVTQSWDNANNLETISSFNGGAYTFVYDDLNRLGSQTWTFGGVSYPTTNHYDANGCLDTMTYPTGTVVTMTCDSLGRTTSVRVGSTYVVDVVTYHPSGHVKRIEYSNGIATDYGEDGRGRTKSITATGNVLALTYTYDGADNVATFANGAVPGSDQIMVHDLLDRLLTASGPLKGTPDYRYDALGNRTYKQEGNTGYISTYSYDPQTNRLASATVRSALPTLKLTWDLAGRLASSSDGSSYKYDARGKRVSKTVGGVTVVYHYDAAGRVIAETTPTGVKLRDYVYVGNQLVVVDGCASGDTPCAATREWYHTDTLGSVLARTDTAGTPKAKLDYLPWGEQFGSGFTGSPGDRQYNGRVTDGSTGFIDYGARLYWPEIGRFVSADTVMGQPESPASLNRYSYVLNNPYRYTDPTGHDAYRQNRDIGTDRVTSNLDPVSHTYVFTTNPDGSVAHTYSWGNAPNIKGWHKDQPEDLRAANDALRRSGPLSPNVLKGGLEAFLEVLAAAKNAPDKVGDATLDPYVEKAFNELNKEENEHQNLFIVRNCKAEAEKLLNRAEALRAQDAKAASTEPAR